MPDYSKPIWNGYLARNPDGTYSGQLVDTFGWPISISAVVEDFEGSKRFRLSGDVRTGRIPADLRLEGVDDPVEAS